MPGWPFWAATSDERIDRALALAGLQAGERLVDLGCGDGRVMLRAAEAHGAVVTGVELDPDLAAAARRALAERGLAGTVVEGDFTETEVAADVVFAYLSPATLQRLARRLAALPAGTRLVTAGYAVPGWVPAERGDGCWLYRLPAPTLEVDRSRRGWENAGLLASIRPDAVSLVAARLHHPGGPVEVRVTDGLVDVAEARPGLDPAEPGDAVVVDLAFEALPEHTVVAGTLDAAGVGVLWLFAVVDAGPPGLWGLTMDGCREAVAAIQGEGLAALVGRARAATPPAGRGPAAPAGGSGA
ncbi:MAG TPA: methyltransferase domain-containing protein [Acidimicrobiales bacterium]|nr:methyltransferase domain-containing protein [Acidimicrobiales bacterium]